MRQKVPYGVAGFLVGMFIIPVFQVILNKTNAQLSLYLLPLILILGIMGVFVGLKLDEYLNDEKKQGSVKATNFIIKYFGFLTLGKRRIEGNYVIYETHHLRNFAVAGILILCYFFVLKYIPKPFGDVLYWIVVVAYIISGLPMANDNIRAVSKKIETNAAGKKEVWYEMPKPQS